MRVFEFHFNPDLKEDLIFDSFCYEPENIYERRLGSFYIIGELKNALPQNYRLLNKISSVLKKEYYWKIQRSPELALKEALKETNEFLSKEVSKNNTSWLGNLDLAIISFKDLLLNFSKVGDVKILLIRGGRINEISKSLEFSEIEPYPLKIFGNIVTGKATEGDIVLILTKEVYDFFISQNLLNEIVKLPTFDEKNIKQIFKSRKTSLLEIFGVCLLMTISKEAEPVETLTFRKKPEKFSLIQIFQPIFNVLNRISFKKIKDLISSVRNSFLNRVKIPKPQINFKPKLKLPQITLKLPAIKFPTIKLPVIKVPAIKLPTVSRPQIPQIKISLNKNLIYIPILIFVLLIGFLIFQTEKKEDLKLARVVFEEVESKITQAGNFLTSGDEEKANNLFQEAWQKILPQTEAGAILKDEATLIKKSIEESLAPLNKLEKISEPEVLSEFKPAEAGLVPQKIILLDSALYSFNPFSSTLYKFDLNKNEGKKISANWHLKSAAIFNDLVLFFARNSDSLPIVSFLNEKDEWQEKKIEFPSADFSFDIFSTFKSNLYFLDKKSGEIVKYSSLNLAEDKSAFGNPWFSSGTKRAVSAKSMSLDGSLWILTEDNKIDRYSGGVYKETLEINLFPYLEKPTEFLVSKTSPFIYLLEPAQKRIIILNKNGKIFKQYQSEKFDNLLDFAVSKDETTIWLLNDSKVFKIEFQAE